MTRLKGLSQAIVKSTLALGLAATSHARAVSAEPFVISGWPLPQLGGAAPDSSMGDDPVVGRQACPPLTRLNLETKRSEDLLLRKAVEEFRDEASGASWRFELRSGLYWWGGAEVQAKDVVRFLEDGLVTLTKERGAGLWKLPEHVIKADGEAVTVKWKTPPPFGPYVLNGAPFWRKSTRDGLKFECAGLYKLEARPFGVALIPAPGYKSRKPLDEIHLYKADTKRTAKARGLDFRYASSFGGTPWTRLADDIAKCQQTMDLPYATMIVWNTKKGPTADVRFRTLMTQLMPRGALVRSAAASLGELLSAPIPRQHPGYSDNITVRSFDIGLVSTGLDQLGYKRQSPEAPRLDAAGKPLLLVLRTQPKSSGLPEKVIADALSAVGISADFTPSETDATDGFLASLSLDWPRSDLLGNFHSRILDAAPFWSMSDPELDKRLEAYSRTLTMAQPSFEALASIHKKLYELEPASVLLQHKACVDASGGVSLPQAAVNTLDPDWFRQLVL